MYWALHNTHAPLEAPRRFLDLYPRFANDTRKQALSAMVSVVDEAVANVTDALRRTGMWETTLLIWTTDNGSPIQVWLFTLYYTHYLRYLLTHLPLTTDN